VLTATKRGVEFSCTQLEQLWNLLLVCAEIKVQSPEENGITIGIFTLSRL
jgi:hypothetical protein